MIAELPRQLVWSVRRDPHHLPEHVVLIAQSRLAEPAREWASVVQSGDTDPGTAAEQLRTATARFSRINGALSGTPFLIALVPAYTTVLWEQARMVMRIAALTGHDPRERRFAAELLCLRGLYRTPEDALVVLSKLDDGSTEPLHGVRARFAAWYQLVYRVLILAGLFSARDPDQPRAYVRTALIWTVGAVVWVITWILPLTFMMLMSYSCESDSRRLGVLAIEHYDVPAPRGDVPREPRSWRRAGWRVVTLTISLGIPFGLVVLAVTNPDGHGVLEALAGFVALTIVLMVSTRAARRPASTLGG